MSRAVKLFSPFILSCILFCIIVYSAAALSVQDNANGTSPVSVPDALTSVTPALPEISIASGIAPVNPEYLRYLKNQQSDKESIPLLKSGDSDVRRGHATGFIPPTVDLSHLQGHFVTEDTRAPASERISALFDAAPASYDLRAIGKITPVKDQGDAGTCWIFASYGSLESYLMPNENWDFSENNIKNLLSNLYPEGFDRNFDSGGNSLMSTAYLARWTGPVNESDDPYNTISPYSPTNKTVRKHVQNVYFIPDRLNSTDNTNIKTALQNYGAIDTSMYMDESAAFWNAGKNSYYYYGSNGGNHDVSIVGWYDDWSKDNFTTPAPANGAFIIKNSWGTSWGDHGFFYISYYDTSVGNNMAVFTAESPHNYNHIYQYDPLGWISSIWYGSVKTGYSANVFNCTQNGNLSAVSFYTTDTNTAYIVSVYKNPNNGPVLNSSGSTGTYTGIFGNAGYHTLALIPEVPLKSGDRFSIAVKLTNPSYDNPIAIEYPVINYSSNATANPGESYVSSNGISWDDLTTINPNTSACIKAFAKNPMLAANFTANISSGSVPLPVQFNDTTTGSPTRWNWSFGDGSLATVQNPLHTYTVAGTYTVSLNATNAGGSNITIRNNYITVFVPLPVPSFTANVTSGKVPLAIQFLDTTTGSPTKWNWSFGDGNYSVVQNPVYIYTNPGIFTVSLNVTNSTGFNISTKTGYITVSSNLPVSNFSSNLTTGGYNMTLLFTDTSIGFPTAWNWSFGDGTFSTSQHPVHTYTQIDDTRRWYNVSLNATNSFGSNMTKKTNYIHILSFSEYYRSVSVPPGNISTSTFVGVVEDWRLQRSVPTFTVSPSTSLFVGLVEDWRLQRPLS